MPETVEFFGDTFEVPERFNMRRVTQFAAAASRGVDDKSLEGMAAVNGLLDQCVRPEDTERFDALCDKHGASIEDLLEFFGSVLEVVTDRPTSQPSVSSDGLRTIEPKSTGDSYSPVIARLENQGRPDLALMVTQAREARSA